MKLKNKFYLLSSQEQGKGAGETAQQIEVPAARPDGLEFDPQDLHGRREPTPESYVLVFKMRTVV